LEITFLKRRKMKIKKDLSKELLKVVEILNKEFPNLSLCEDVGVYKELDRSDDRVYFESTVDIPKIFINTLFKELVLSIRFKLVENSSSNDTLNLKQYYWANVSWNYVHPANGTNGHSFCDISLKLDGEVLSIRTEKQKEEAGCL
jgi:hypothetical protein